MCNHISIQVKMIYVSHILHVCLPMYLLITHILLLHSLAWTIHLQSWSDLTTNHILIFCRLNNLKFSIKFYAKDFGRSLHAMLAVEKHTFSKIHWSFFIRHYCTNSIHIPWESIDIRVILEVIKEVNFLGTILCMRRVHG